MKESMGNLKEHGKGEDRATILKTSTKMKFHKRMKVSEGIPLKLDIHKKKKPGNLKLI